MDGLFNPIFSAFSEQEWETKNETSTLPRPTPQWLPEQYKVPGGKKLKVGDHVRALMPVGSPVVGTVIELFIEFDEPYWEEKLNEGYRTTKAVNVDTLLEARPLIYPWVRVAPDDGSPDGYFGLEEIIRDDLFQEE